MTTRGLAAGFGGSVSAIRRDGACSVLLVKLRKRRSKPRPYEEARHAVQGEKESVFAWLKEVNHREEYVFGAVKSVFPSAKYAFYSKESVFLPVKYLFLRAKYGFPSEKHLADAAGGGPAPDKFGRALQSPHMQNEWAIEARGLARRYRVGGEEVAALAGVDLSVARGEFVALVGPSGSGKSTLLNLLGGLDRPTGGTVRVAGLELGGASEAQLVRYRREQVGFVFQSFNLLPMRSAVENVEMPLVLSGAGSKERRRVALDLLASVKLAARAKHRPGELSGGEMQRVAVARALVNSPALLLADEPTGNLDSVTGQGILDLLREAVTSRGVTLVLVTHDPRVASYADRVVHLLDGRIERIETNKRAPVALVQSP